MEKARKAALLSLKDYKDTAFAKVKVDLYDLDIFIRKNFDKNIDIEAMLVNYSHGSKLTKYLIS